MFGVWATSCRSLTYIDPRVMPIALCELPSRLLSIDDKKIVKGDVNPLAGFAVELFDRAQAEEVEFTPLNSRQRSMLNRVRLALAANNCGPFMIHEMGFVA